MLTDVYTPKFHVIVSALGETTHTPEVSLGPEPAWKVSGAIS